ncbi:MAG: efflux RND transporter periplasmic adaptor subunit [Pirellulaceae bacterium]|jgi:HlyD family secretion protein|nr:efflux RND transporter periplasmic adaptor subunit [Pirellulaceae bacterium]
MRLLIKLLIAALILAGIGWFSYQPMMSYWQERNKPQWETAAVIFGDAKRVITSTGKIEPVLKVAIGSFVSGPIVELHVDFNDEVKEGDLLAKVDPLLYQAAVDRDQANLSTREAEVNRVKAQLKLAENNLARGEKLRQKNEKYLSDREMDALTAEYTALEASLEVAEASVKQARAQLDNSKTNLDYCEIKSPVDGVILERKIDPGQTLASQFQTPELFVVAPDLRKKLHVFASVDESDIGLIRRAFENKLPVKFTVDAYPDEVFEGYIEQIRLSATEVQNVITYPVVVATENPDLKLLPSMTAQISFEVDSKERVLKVPNAALRYYPERPQYVNEEDRKLLDGSQWNRQGNQDNPDSTSEKDPELSATERAANSQGRSKRHVWVVREGILHAIEIEVGFSESRYSVVVSGELEEGMELVTGMKK